MDVDDGGRIVSGRVTWCSAASLAPGRAGGRWGAGGGQPGVGGQKSGNACARAARAAPCYAPSLLHPRRMRAFPLLFTCRFTLAFAKHDAHFPRLHAAAFIARRAHTTPHAARTPPPRAVRIYCCLRASPRTALLYAHRGEDGVAATRWESSVARQ